MGWRLDRNGHSVTLWEYDPGAFEQLAAHRSQPDKLNSFVLPDSIRVTDDLEDAVPAGDLLVIAVPSQNVRYTVKQIGGRIRRFDHVVNLSKGIENHSLQRMSEVIIEETGLRSGSLVTVSGPSHAEEVVKDAPTTVVAAGPSESAAQSIQEIFSGGNFRVYYSNDLIGVELGGSLKNIIAIAAGIADGLGLGDNTKGALLTRGLAEISRLGIALGAHIETFAGLSGVGDLVTTCFSRHSRNRSVGERIGRGEKLADILKSMTMVAEGVATCRSGYELARRHDVEMPITTEVYRVLFEDKPPAEAVADLMGRKLKAEIWQ